MDAKAGIYIPLVFRSFQGFQVLDVKEFRTKTEMVIILSPVEGKEHFCTICGEKLGRQDGGYWVRARHMRIMNWSVFVEFRREKKRLQ